MLNRISPAVAISAGTQQVSSGSLIFSNSNGVSFGINGNTLTASAAGGGGGAFTGGMSTFGNTLGNTGLVTGQLVLVGTNNITLSGSTNGGSMTISFSGGAGAAGNTGYISAGTLTASLGTVVFSNSGGVSFGINGQTVTATVATNYLTTADLSQNSSKYIQAWDLTGNTAGTTSSAQGTALWLSGGNSITVSGNSNTIVFSVGNYLTTADLSQNSSKYAGINGAITGGSITVNTSGVSVALPAYLTTAMQSNATTISNINVSAGTTSQNLSALVFSNSNNFSFGLNGSTITGSYTVPTQTNQSGNVYASSNTFGTSSGTYDARSLSIAGSGAVSVAASNSGWVISAPTQTNDTGKVYASSNTFGTSSGTFDVRTLSIAGSGAVSVAASNSGWVISAPTQTAQTQNCVDLSLSGNSTSAGAGYILISSGTAVLAGGNNITLSQNGQSITISGANAAGAQTGISGIADSAHTQTVGTLSFANSNGVTFGLSTGANTGTLTASVAAQTNQTGGVYASSNTFGTSSGTYDARSISIAGSGNVSIAASNSGWVVSVPNQTNQTGNVYASSNTFGTSSGTYDARSLSIAGSGAVSVAASNSGFVISAPVQTNQSVGLYALGNTTQNSSTTLDARSLSYNAIGAMSWGYSNGSIQASVPATSSLSATGWASISVNGSTISIGASTTASLYAVGNTTNNTTQSQDIRTVSFAGLGQVSVGFSGGTMQVSGPALLSAFEPLQLQTNTSVSSFATNSYIFQKILIPDPLACSKINVLKSLNAAVGANVTTKTFNLTYFHGLTLFSRQDYTNNSSNLSSFASASFGISHTFSYSSLSGSATVAWATNSAGGTSSASFTDSIISGMTSYLTGLKFAQIPFVATLTSPEIWIAHNESSSTSGSPPCVSVSFSDVYMTPLVSTIGAWSNSGSDTARNPQGEGFGNASATANTMPFSNISAATQAFIYHNYSNVLVT
jgi:hypothetical protein